MICIVLVCHVPVGCHDLYYVGCSLCDDRLVGGCRFHEGVIGLNEWMSDAMMTV